MSSKPDIGLRPIGGPEIVKADGDTESERYLADLCSRTFLSLWSYPNIYRTAGKELCDLLVVFGDHVVIFSDKNCRFGDQGDFSIAWGRWYRDAIGKSVRQVFGARRHLQVKTPELYLDKACKRPFPLALPSNPIVHCALVAHGSTEACRNVTGGSGSLSIRPEVHGADHEKHPFVVGQPDPSKGFVHVFDDVALEVVLLEMNTVSDFVEYLVRREALFHTGRFVGADGEEDLVAFYLSAMGPDGHDFVLPAGDGKVIVESDQWNAWVSSQEYAKKHVLDRPSYAWDFLIEQFGSSLLDRSMLTVPHTPLSDLELGLRSMASESRLCRRGLAQQFLELLARAKRGETVVRTIADITRGRAYVFWFRKPDPALTYDEYRQMRSVQLLGYLMAAKTKYRQVNEFIGIAMEPDQSSGGSEDLIYLDTTNWSAHNERQAQEAKEMWGFFRDESFLERSVSVDEYGSDERKGQTNRQF